MTTNESGQTGSSAPLFNKAWYDRLKFLAQIALPGVGALYFGIAQIWGLPKGEEVVGTIVVVDTFLGLLLGISTSQYNKVKYDGDIIVNESVTGRKTLELQLEGDEGIENQKELLFKVKRDTPPLPPL